MVKYRFKKLLDLGQHELKTLLTMPQTHLAPINSHIISPPLKGRTKDFLFTPGNFLGLGELKYVFLKAFQPPVKRFEYPLKQDHAYYRDSATHQRCLKLLK